MGHLVGATRDDRDPWDDRREFRVRRYVRGRMVRDYGSFPCRGLAEYVALRASEAHIGEAGYVAVEPEETS